MRVAVGTLRLRSADADTPALRLRAARELQAADLRPAGLPPAAILVIRRLRDPMPGRFGAGRLRPLPAWERAVRDHLGVAARTAARVDERGRLPSSAPAVLFADEAELLACLVADRARGEIAARWWWEAVWPRLGLPVGASDIRRDTAPVLAARPREAPAALARIVRWGEATHVAATIPERGAAAVLLALAREHALPLDLVARPAASSSPVGGVRSWAPSPVAVESRAPWIDWVPPALDERRLPPEVRCLFGVALGLGIAPARLRSHATIVQARRWWQLVSGESLDLSAGDAMPARDGRARDRVLEPKRPRPVRSLGPDGTAAFVSPLETGATAVAAPVTGRRERREGDESGTEAEANPPSTTTRHMALSEPADPAAAPEAPAPAAAAGPSVQARAEESSPAQVRNVPGLPQPADPGRRHDRIADPIPSSRRRTSVPRPRANVPPATTPPPVETVEDRLPEALSGEGVITDVGGVLYLVHVLQDLNLPDAFEGGWGLPAQAGPWGTLDLVGRALLGRRFARVARDPLWRALALMADWPRHGRRMPATTSATRPTAGAADPPFRAPAAWLARVDDPGDRFEWAERGGRVWVWSERGFLVIHRRCRRAGVATARRALGRLLGPGRAFHLTRGRASAIPWSPLPALPAGCPPRAGRWAAAAQPAIRRRLLLGLGIDPQAPRARDDDAIPNLLGTRGRLFVTSSHVDLVMTLDSADLAARRAGLDRSPGWLPAYGRVIYFHFHRSIH